MGVMILDRQEPPTGCPRAIDQRRLIDRHETVKVHHARSNPGDLFCCDASAFDGASHPGTAQPMGDVSVLRMKKEAYFKMLRGNPDAAMEVIRYLGSRLNEAQEKAKILALDSADQRLASLLVSLAERSGVADPNGVRLSVRLTRQDMANMVGVTTETAIRIIARFKKNQLVSGTASRLVIRNLSKLKQLAST